MMPIKNKNVTLTTLIAVVVLMQIACESKKTDKSSKKIPDSIRIDSIRGTMDNDLKQEIAHDAVHESIILKDGDTLLVTYNHDKLKIIDKKRTVIEIPYATPEKKILPCECIAIFRNGKIVDHKKYQIYNDPFLLFPVFDFNGRINVFVIDLHHKSFLAVGKNNNLYFLTTYLPWILFDEDRSLIITANSLDINGKTMVHFYKVSKTGSLENIYNKSTQSDNLIFSDDGKMAEFLSDVINTPIPKSAID